jgi:hypothetical protein
LSVGVLCAPPLPPPPPPPPPRAGDVWHLEGPDVLTADDLFDLLGEGAPAHVPPAEAGPRLSDLLGVPVSSSTAELFAIGTPAPEPGIGDAAEELAIALTSVEEGMRITADRAARSR